MAMSTARHRSYAVVSGPALGGFIYRRRRLRSAYGVCAGIFIVSMACAFAISKVQVKKAKEPVSLRTVFAGFAFMKTQPVVLGAISARPLRSGPWWSDRVVARVREGHPAHRGAVGLLRAAPAIGARLVMALALTRAPMDRHVGRRLFTAVAIYGVSILGFAFSTHFIVAMIALAVSGAADMVSIVVRQTLVAGDAPDEMRGRVSRGERHTSSARATSWANSGAGATATFLGPVGSVVLGGAGTLLVVALWIRLFPQLARRDKLVPERLP